MLVIGLVYLISIESNYVNFGLDRDEGSYINFGEVLRTGGDLYQDVYSVKPPAIYYTYGLINSIFGYSATGLRWSVIIFNALAAILLFLFGYRWRGPFFGFIAAISFSFLAFNPKLYGFAALAEQYQNFFLILSVVLLQHGLIKRKWIWFLIGGFVITFGLLIKQNLIFSYVALAIILAWYFLIESKEREWKPLINFVIGSAVATVIIFLPVILQGGVEDWIYWNFYYSSLYTSVVTWEQGMENFGNYLNHISAFNRWMWIAGLIGIVLGYIRAKSLSSKLGVLLFFIAAVCAILPGLRFYPHYWMYLSPILAIGCAWFFYWLAQLLSTKLNSYLPHAVATFLFVVGLVSVVARNQDFFDSPQEAQINRMMYGENPFTEMRYLGEYLNKRIKSNEQFIMFGSEPQIYTYLGRPTPTPYIFFSQLTKEHERKDEMVADLQSWVQTNKPKYVGFTNSRYSWTITEDGDRKIFNWASIYVQQGHKVIAVADILPSGPKFVYGDDAANYQPTSTQWVRIFERIAN